ncbi:hypothetical protein BP6252_12419 [Coleophoma cylindrospora]|uniref:UDP-N-acetylglucosamine transferase subunit ALG13 n=1 Tax=Coleophoma cylindrospora TaxID=1849047 RepID=A0A3D8QGR5_9HELO|nr:hypothetical protein BP6252_12419 [Coleophoma cylindrospora]
MASDGLDRELFVTIGATAAFDELLSAVLDPDFQNVATELNFTKMRIQCGKSLEKCKSIISAQPSKLDFNVFDFRPQGLNNEMRATTALPGKRHAGVVITHAGAGTVLDAMRLGCHIIVVPNESLLDNHQGEMADELQKQGYVTKGRTSSVQSTLAALGSALSLSQALRRCVAQIPSQSANYTWPPPGAGNVTEIVDEMVLREEAMHRRLD